LASCSEIEEWLSILGAGIAGLRLLKEFGIRTSELEFFIKNFGKGEIQISAFAPSVFRDQYEPRLEVSRSKVKAGIARVVESNVTDEVVESVLADAKEFYSLLSDLRQTVVSGFVVV
jgi:hypothetical protein